MGVEVTAPNKNMYYFTGDIVTRINLRDVPDLGRFVTWGHGTASMLDSFVAEQAVALQVRGPFGPPIGQARTRKMWATKTLCDIRSKRRTAAKSPGRELFSASSLDFSKKLARYDWAARSRRRHERLDSTAASSSDDRAFQNEAPDDSKSDYGCDWFGKYAKGSQEDDEDEEKAAVPTSTQTEADQYQKMEETTTELAQDEEVEGPKTADDESKQATATEDDLPMPDTCFDYNEEIMSDESPEQDRTHCAQTLLV
ncbi:hypothetical protein ATCC90586_008632 [Pythium insidiosum]|nr:hypothetical protein ATCC90586_008632 [Pythium insidiosum]